MDFENLIKKLQKERSALDEVIASLEAMRASPERNRPGRKVHEHGRTPRRTAKEILGDEEAGQP